MQNCTDPVKWYAENTIKQNKLNEQRNEMNFVFNAKGDSPLFLAFKFPKFGI